MAWFKRSSDPQDSAPAGDPRADLIPDLKTQRLHRAVRDFPGRPDADLARIIYGRADPDLIAAEGRRLEAAGLVTRDPEGGGLYASQR